MIGNNSIGETFRRGGDFLARSRVVYRRYKRERRISQRQAELWRKQALRKNGDGLGTELTSGLGVISALNSRLLGISSNSVFSKLDSGSLELTSKPGVTYRL